MQDLTRPQVLTSALLAALATALACHPSLALWTARPLALWALDALLFACAWVIWGFVFAWHERYARRPLIPRPANARLWAAATGAAVLFGTLFHFLSDPSIRANMPGELPKNGLEWITMTLFILAFQQLFLVFGPIAFFARLLNSGRLAAILTLFFGGVILVAKAQPLTASLSWFAGAGFLTARLLAGFLTIYFYMRGGIPLALAWALALQARLLPGLM